MKIKLFLEKRVNRGRLESQLLHRRPDLYGCFKNKLDIQEEEKSQATIGFSILDSRKGSRPHFLLVHYSRFVFERVAVKMKKGEGKGMNIRLELFSSQQWIFCSGGRE